LTPILADFITKETTSVFAIIHFPQFDSNMPTTYGDFIPQLIHYTRACHCYSDFLQRHRILSTKLVILGIVEKRPFLSFKKRFTDDINILLKSTISVCVQMTNDGIGD
jgi:hypothetical protein